MAVKRRPPAARADSGHRDGTISLPPSRKGHPGHSSHILLSRAALRRNLSFVRRQIGEGVRLSSVIKGNAYGHGIEHFVPLAESLGVDHFAVFDAREAYRVSHCKRPDTGVMVMGFVDPEELEWAVESGVEFYVFDFHRLEAAIAVARRLGKPARIHLELETGLNRTGFTAAALPRVVEKLQEHPDAVILEGLCTHYAGAESVSNYLRIREQIEHFRTMDGWLRERGVHPRFRHTACSAAALSYPETIMDMVRIGIVQYGFWPSTETKIHYLARTGRLSERPLRRVITWKSRVMGVKKVAVGEFVGYGTSFLADHPTRIATIPVGYAHGFARSLSNQGHVLVRGRRVPVAGIVNMNLTIVDVSSVPDVQVGDEVVLIGSQNHQAITVSSFSDLSNQLNYELLTRLPADIPREVVE